MVLGHLDSLNMYQAICGADISIYIAPQLLEINIARGMFTAAGYTLPKLLKTLITILGRDTLCESRIG